MGIGLGNNGQPTYQGTPAAGNAASNPSLANSKPPPPNSMIGNSGGKGGYGGGKGGSMAGAQALQQLGQNNPQAQLNADYGAYKNSIANPYNSKPPPPGLQGMRGMGGGGIQDLMQRQMDMRMRMGGRRDMPPPGTLNTSTGQTSAPISPQAADIASGIGNLLGGDMRGTNTAADPAALPTPPAPTTTAPNPTTPQSTDPMQRDMSGYRRYLGRGLGGLGKGGKGGGMRGGTPMPQGYAEGGKVSWSLPPMSGAPAGNVGAVGGTATPGTGPSMFGNLKMSGFKPMAPASAGIKTFTPMAPVADPAASTKKFTPSIQAQFLLGMGADPKVLFGKNYDAWASQPVTQGMFYAGRKATGRQGPR